MFRNFVRGSKGATINDLGEGPEEIEKKKISEALPQENIIPKRHIHGKNKSIFDSSSCPPPDH